MSRTMTAVLCTLGLGSALFFIGRSQAAGTPITPTSPCDSITGAPLVSMEVSGGTLTGLIYARLSVSDDGIATYVAGGGMTQPMAATIQTVSVPPSAIQQLQKDIRESHAFTLCDVATVVNDMPMTTVTVFSGGADARAHTFSYFFPAIGDNSKLHDALTKFQQTWFPSNPVGG